MPPHPTIYLDVETDWKRNLTVLGFHSQETGTVQLVGSEITLCRLKLELPRTGRLVTFNGHCFDLPVIRRQLGLDLRTTHKSIDLRWLCRRYGLCGGQKVVEQLLGVPRKLVGINGQEAIRLWGRYRRGDEEALRILLSYNEEDLLGMKIIDSHLKKLPGF
jgi:uncharacterized protein YprB with RNaseH-like and TPR domain